MRTNLSVTIDGENLTKAMELGTELCRGHQDIVAVSVTVYDEDDAEAESEEDLTIFIPTTANGETQ